MVDARCATMPAPTRSSTIASRRHLPEQGSPFPVVRYQAKVKLHGSNCAVQVTPHGIHAQSRTVMLTPEADYKGFAAWVHDHQSYFAALAPGVVVFGEWCGPGVERGMAVSEVASKLFVVFAVQFEGRVVFEPAAVRALLPVDGAPATLHVLPWEGEPITIDYGSPAALELAAAALNERVIAVEHEDPWVKQTFEISGLGEGLVFYPVDVDGAAPPDQPEGLASLMFKAKGEKHRTAATKVAVQVNASVVDSVVAFVALMVTPARLQQGLAAVGDGTADLRQIGKFLAWIAADVRKESVAELEASGLTWSQVEKAATQHAREWFLAQSRR